jgi:hypothetical protein
VTYRECACACNCANTPSTGCDDLCAKCWQAWCDPLAKKANAKHRPGVGRDRSYLGTYGLTGIFTNWLLNRRSQLLEFPISYWTTPEVPPRCPGDGRPCGQVMRRRDAAWKCYHHTPWIAIPIPEPMPALPHVAPTIPVAEIKDGRLS